MQLIEVGQNPKHCREFLMLPVRLYKNHPYWIRPLDKDIEDTFNAATNNHFEDGECTRWIATDDNGQTVGRIAAFIDQKTVHKNNDQPTGGTGFFECIDDQKVASALFDQAKSWLQARGMAAMDGPINFGERDRRWGLLVGGYDQEPLYGMDYHFEYYKPLFENYGFQEYFKQYTYWMPIPGDEVKKIISASVLERSARIQRMPGYDFRHVEKKNLAKYAEDFRSVYNLAWANHLSTGEISEEHSLALMKRMKPILEEDLMWFGYFEDRPIAFFIVLPDLNQLIKHVNGKLNWLGMAKMLYYKLRKTNQKAFGVIFGVIPEFQGRGVESAVALAFGNIAWQNPDFQYKTIEFNWVGDFNIKMNRFSKMLGGVVSKTHATYRYLFDQTQEFKRHPNI
ncbi:MAG: hypothetical protein EAZ70_04200 [Runella slithyformis]|nr:MAG: hypothetical protein EAY79_01690 [Runella slithyformis]TAF28863.1 MAG: hypothetical protein EAZ70_04200 [Runella slithyformis]TAF48980.1 MAG: hypothetical protein EAZ63_03040 [Runella slithyformis]TAF83541.1 MAG: hypothetical protein EAZ50_00990 [Runella slithyformis]